MEKLFSTCLLVQDGVTAPEYMVTGVNLHPGRGISSDHGEAVLIAGGFSSIVPESQFPLSAALQLNYDLATFTHEELKRIAEAELKRKNEVDYRSYTLEVDNRVCLIGDSVSKINEWTDQFGGLLEISPLLLKGSHPDIPAVVELNIEDDDSGCRITFQVRSPIDTERCSYCGDCGPACPESSISKDLFLNFDTCTLCKKCEKVCLENAIDIHSVVNEILLVPAIILVGDVQVNLPEHIREVYDEKDILKYFANLYPCRIDEIVTCDNTICQYSGRFGTGCDLCLSSCSYGAISQDRRGVMVDSLKCEECGDCIAVCPTGALQNERFTDRSFVEYFLHVDLAGEATVIIGDESDLHKLWWQQQGNRRQNVFFLQYDFSKSLSLFHFVFLLNHGARKILVLKEESSVSKRVAGMEKQIELANLFMEALYDIEDAVRSVSVGDFALCVDAPAVGSCGMEKIEPVFVNRRRTLALSLEKLVKRSGRQPQLRPEGYVPFARISCDTDRCTHCMACLNDCRIEALTSDRQQLTLNCTGIMCVGCGICAGVCPENALTISPRFTLSSDFFSPAELARAEAMTCKKCGKVFGTKKSFERVMAILSQKETVDTTHFEYCDTCRVVRLFEEE